MTANKQHDPELRSAIIQEMKRKGAEYQELFGHTGYSTKTPWYCTWWFKFEIPQETRIIRAELERMERDGLVISDRSRSNNTLWALTEKADDNQ